MDNDESDFPIGYKKPPLETRFKPGQSGNPSGRPKKKAITLAEAIDERTQYLRHRHGRRQVEEDDQARRHRETPDDQGSPVAITKRSHS